MRYSLAAYVASSAGGPSILNLARRAEQLSEKHDQSWNYCKRMASATRETTTDFREHVTGYPQPNKWSVFSQRKYRAVTFRHYEILTNQVNQLHQTNRELVKTNEELEGVVKQLVAQASYFGGFVSGLLESDAIAASNIDNHRGRHYRDSYARDIPEVLREPIPLVQLSRADIRASFVDRQIIMAQLSPLLDYFNHANFSD